MQRSNSSAVWLGLAQLLFARSIGAFYPKLAKFFGRLVGAYLLSHSKALLMFDVADSDSDSPGKVTSRWLSG